MPQLRSYVLHLPFSKAAQTAVFCFLAGCFRPAPPLEDGDAKEPSTVIESAPDGSVSTQAHPVVLKRLPNKLPVQAQRPDSQSEPQATSATNSTPSPQTETTPTPVPNQNSTAVINCDFANTSGYFYLQGVPMNTSRVFTWSDLITYFTNGIENCGGAYFLIESVNGTLTQGNGSSTAVIQNDTRLTRQPEVNGVTEMTWTPPMNMSGAVIDIARVRLCESNVCKPFTVSLRTTIFAGQIIPLLSAGNVSGLKPVLTLNCEPTALSHTASSSLGRVQSVTCAGNGSLSVIVHLPAGSSSFAVTVQSNYSDGSNQQTTSTFTRTPFICPSGYVGVPGSGIPGLGNASASKGNASWWLDVDRDFCVMKYPAKNNNGSTYASSTISSTPWVSIPRGIDEMTSGSAFKACKDIPAGIFRLISNTQWQTIARNAESIRENWSSSIVGTGAMARGHSDQSPNNPLENGQDDQPYFGTGNGPTQNVEEGWEQKRTRMLSNGELIWDIGGNVWQWVSDFGTALGMMPNFSWSGLGWLEFSNQSYFPISGSFAGVNRLLYAPEHDLNSIMNVGKIIGGDIDTVARGGNYDAVAALNIGYRSPAGPFATKLDVASWAAHPAYGFRCASLPQ